MKQLERENEELRRALREEQKAHARTAELRAAGKETQKLLLERNLYLEQDKADALEQVETLEYKLKEARRNGERLYTRLEMVQQVINDAINKREF